MKVIKRYAPNFQAYLGCGFASFRIGVAYYDHACDELRPFFIEIVLGKFKASFELGKIAKNGWSRDSWV